MLADPNDESPANVDAAVSIQEFRFLVKFIKICVLVGKLQIIINFCRIIDLIETNC